MNADNRYFKISFTYFGREISWYTQHLYKFLDVYINLTDHIVLDECTLEDYNLGISTSENQKVGD